MPARSAARLEGNPSKKLHSSTAVKKAVDTLAIVPTKDRISILARKVYNVMMFYAQAQGVEQQIYRVRLRDVIYNIDFNSNNTEILKEHLRQMVTTKVEWQSPTRGEGTSWGVSALIAHAELLHEGGEVMMEWSYAPNIKQAILDPLRFARISLTFQSQLKSTPGLVLYEICSRYVDNPGGLTARQHWTWWRPVLTGFPEGQGGTYDEWKYFKRDVIKGAVAEVNQVTDLQIEAVEHKRGRAMQELQFKVARKEGRPAMSKAVTPVNLKHIGRAINHGVSQERAEKFLERYGEQAFTQGVDALEARADRKDLEQVRAPEKFLGAILANSTVAQDQTPTSPTTTRNEKASRVALLEKYRDRKRAEAESLFKEMPDGEQANLLADFELLVIGKANPAVQKSYRSRGLAATMARALFLKFIAASMFGQGWETPSDSDLLTFSLHGH